MASAGLDAEFDEYHVQVDGTGDADGAESTFPTIAVFQNTPEWNGNLVELRAAAGGRDCGSLARDVDGLVPRFVHMFEFEKPLIDQTESYTLVDASVAWTSPATSCVTPCTAATSPTRNTRSAGTTSPGLPATFGIVAQTASTARPARTAS